MKQKKFFIFFGPPGSGKGTQTDMLGERLNLPVISPGELLRRERDEGTAIGKKADSLISKGELVPDELIKEILDKRLSRKDVKNGFIFDGYPRRRSQLGLFGAEMEKVSSEKDLISAFYIKVSDEEVKSRIGGRRVCDCGAAYHLKFNPPKKEDTCDLCGAGLYKRKDDQEEVLEKRLHDYHERIDPLLEYFKNNYKLIEIDGEQSIEDVKKEIWKKIGCAE